MYQRVFEVVPPQQVACTKASSIENLVYLLSLFCCQIMWEHDLEADQQVASFCSFVHVVLFVVYPHAFARYLLDCLGSDDFVDGQQNCPAVQERNFNWFAQYRILESNTLSVHQVCTASAIA